MSSLEVELERCPICNNSLTSERNLKLCKICKEYFTFGNKQFHLVYGSNKSFTAVGGRSTQLRLISRNIHVPKFCRSIDQLRKSDLDSLEVSLSCFQTAEEMKSLTYFISNHTPLKILDIELYDSEHLKIVLDAIETSSSIRKLRLKNGCSQLNEANAALVVSMLKNNKSIRRLVVNSIRSDQRTINTEFIYDGISENTTIKSLTIDGTSTRPFRFGDSIKELILVRPGSANLKFLEDAFTANMSIQHLKITNSYLKVIAAIKHNTSIKKLEVVRTKFDDSAFDTLSQVLKCHPSLSYVALDMISTFSLITSANIQLLCDGVQQSQSITKFHWHCPLDDEPAECILNGTTQSKILKELKLCVQPERLLEISPFTEALKSPSCALKKLDLHRCNIHTNSTLSLALALEANSSLEDVNLKRTHFSSEALKVLQRWLVKNSRLKSIKLGNEFEENGDGINLATIIKNNTTLTTLHYYSKIEEVDSVMEALKFNDTLTDLSINAENNDLFVESVTKKFTNASIAFENSTDLFTDFSSKQELIERMLLNWGNSETNKSLRKLTNHQHLFDNTTIEEFTKRNIKYQSLMWSNTIVLIHNIARDSNAFERLPREIWLIIFEKLRYPGLPNFRSVADKIFRTTTSNNKN